MPTASHEYTTVDKSAWGPGLWQDESDKMQWIDEATGLDCLIVRGPVGALCGYVGVPEGHPFFGIEYSGCAHQPRCEESWCSHTPESVIEVHGGLTFTDFCQDHTEDRGICHVPFEGRPERVWWLGFDCAHSDDACPKYDGLSREGRYKDRRYVEREVAKLARQLKRIGDGLPAREPDEDD